MDGRICHLLPGGPKDLPGRFSSLFEESMKIIKGMVQVLGTTYRVVQIEASSYQVIRIRDEVLAGTFSCTRKRSIVAHSVEAGLMKRIAAAAVQQGRTTWMRPLAAFPA
jgi:hypothetical protein